MKQILYIIFATFFVIALFLLLTHIAAWRTSLKTPKQQAQARDVVIGQDIANTRTDELAKKTS